MWGAQDGEIRLAQPAVRREALKQRSGLRLLRVGGACGQRAGRYPCLSTIEISAGGADLVWPRRVFAGRDTGNWAKFAGTRGV